VSYVKNDGDLTKWTIGFVDIGQMGLTFPGQAPGNDNPYPYGIILFSNIPN
jgi:hypothetical protein